MAAWEAENLKPCPHSEAYACPSPCPAVDVTTMRCADCELAENLWLCLECGQFHCGRKQWEAGALPGNGHALEHFRQTGHALAVKVASLQEVSVGACGDGQNRADVHCYKCDDCAAYNYGDVALPRVLEVLERFGVVADGKVVGLDEARREKTLTELNLIANRDFEFSTVGLLHRRHP